MKYYILISLCFLLVVISASVPENKTIDITITNIRSSKGEIRIGLCKDDENFQKEKSFKVVSYKKQNLVNGTLHVKLELEYGVYGMSLLDDENSNTKMDYNFIGLPKEGFGFSNYYHTGFTKPHFDNFKFTHQKNAKTNVVMKIRYM
jgi:uncharacterized protein (DUF2141 family)